MKWKKLGKIFNPLDHKLHNNCFEFAQSPQALVFDNFVRIYFSTREKDNEGKFLSHVSFVDFDKSLTKIIAVADKEVIPLGDLGCFDEHGIFPMNIVKDNDRILAYTTGWNRKISVSADASIGHAYSTDNGLTFQKTGKGPVMTASLHEPFLVCDAFVKKIDEVYYMWYIYGVKWIKSVEEEAPQRVYKIAQATSFDGLTWQRDGKKIIADTLHENECQALPAVIEYKGKYHMIFCYRDAFGFRTDKSKGYRLGYAFSEDLVNWTRDDENIGINVSADGWDSDMMCYPNIFTCNNKVYLLYNGNEFGRQGFGLAVLED